MRSGVEYTVTPPENSAVEKRAERAILYPSAGSTGTTSRPHTIQAKSVQHPLESDRKMAVNVGARARK